RHTRFSRDWSFRRVLFRSRQAPEVERDHARRYLGRADADVLPGLVRAAYASVADTVLVPWQDHLALGSEARMNTPGKPEGNWSRSEERRVGKERKARGWAW